MFYVYSLLLLAAEAGGDAESWGKIVAPVAVLGAIVLLAAKWGMHHLDRQFEAANSRELRMAARLDMLEDAYRTQLTKIIEDCNACIQGNTKALEDVRAYTDQQAGVIKELADATLSKEDIIKELTEAIAANTQATAKVADSWARSLATTPPSPESG